MKKIILSVILISVFVSGCISSDTFTGTRITGNEIVFASDKGSTGNELYLMNADGTNIRRLTFNNFDDNNPAFSPDKKKIAFHRALNPVDGRTYDIFVLDLETGQETKITNNNLLDGHPDWSPDGKKLVFARFNRPNTADLFVIDLETGEETQLTDTEYEENDPEWSPDGKYIAFKSTEHTNESGKEEIYVMNADGTNIKRLTNITGWQSDHDPSWSSDSKYIYFERFEGGTVPWYKIQDTSFFIANWQKLVPWNSYRVDLEGNLSKITDCEYICWLPVQYNDDKIIFLKDTFNFINNTLFTIKVDYNIISPDGNDEQLLLSHDEFYNKQYFDF